MLFLFGWPPCQRSDMILMVVSQRAYAMIHYISGLYGYLYVCEIYVNLTWYLYSFMLNKFCLSLSLSLIILHLQVVDIRFRSTTVITAFGSAWQCLLNTMSLKMNLPKKIRRENYI